MKTIKQVNIHAAKTQLSALVDDVAKGTPFIIAKSGKPLAKVTPIQEKSAPRFGALKGKIVVPNNFDRMYEDEIYEMFGGLEK